MSAKQIGKQLVELCKQGKNMESIDKYYAENVESIEASPPPGGERAVRGIAAVRGKNTWWVENHEIHKAEAEGPFPHGGDKFAVIFRYDVTNKPSKQRIKLDEVAVFTVANGKIVREEFFYDMG
jgi:ketosteroid isomerase-like protein